MEKDEVSIKQQENKRKEYTATDSSKMFVYALLIPEIALIFIMFLSMFVLGMFGADLEVVRVSMTYSVFLTISSSAVLLFICWYYNKANGIDSKVALRISKKIDYKIVLMLVVMALVAVFGSVLLISLFDSALVYFGYHASESAVNVDTWYNYIICLFVLCLLPAFVEELIYRGIVQNGLVNTMGKKAIIITALFFTLMHGTINQTIYQFVLGLILCLVAYTTGNILYSMILHFLNNAIVVTLSYIGNFVDVTFFESWQLWVIILVAVVLFILAVLILWFMIKAIKKHVSKEKVKQLTNLNGENVVEIESSSVLEPQKTRQLTKAEKIYLGLGVGIALSMWLINTISAFIG